MIGCALEQDADVVTIVASNVRVAGHRQPPVCSLDVRIAGVVIHLQDPRAQGIGLRSTIGFQSAPVCESVGHGSICCCCTVHTNSNQEGSRDLCAR